MISSAKQNALRGFLAFGVLVWSTSASAVTVTIDSPSNNSTWQAGASASCVGEVYWSTDPDNPENRPVQGAVYVHAGGNGGTVTNSAFMTFSNIDDTDGIEDWAATVTLTAQSPPIGGNKPPYAVEARVFVRGGNPGFVSTWAPIVLTNG